MARTKERSNTNRRSNKKGPKAVITRSADERNTGGGRFFGLQDDERFEGYALFNPDPKAENNPGWLEFKQHWDAQRGSYVPCWGAKNGCLFCKAGMNPSQRALAAFLITKMNGEDLKEPEVKVFRMNWGMIQEWADEFDDEGATLGQLVRIKCLDHGDGDYKTKFFDKKRLSKKDIKAATEDIPDLEDSVQKQLDRALENLRIESVLEDDDDEDEDDDDTEEEVTPKSKKRGRPSKKNKEEDEDDEDDDDDDDDDEEEDEDEDETDDDEDEEDEESDDEDEDDEDSDDDDEEDDDDDEADEDEEDEDEDDEDSSISGEYTVVSANESEMTMTLKELDSDLYFDQSVAGDIEWDDFKKGTKVNVTAEKDEDGDWVATEFSAAKAKRGRGRPKGSKNKKKK